MVAKLAGDGVQPQVPSATRTFAWNSISERTQFFKEFAHYADGYLPGTENEIAPVPRYAALTVQHGNPVDIEVHRKILKVSNAEMQTL